MNFSKMFILLPAELSTSIFCPSRFLVGKDVQKRMIPRRNFCRQQSWYFWNVWKLKMCFAPSFASIGPNLVFLGIEENMTFFLVLKNLQIIALIAVFGWNKAKVTTISRMFSDSTFLMVSRIQKMGPIDANEGAKHIFRVWTFQKYYFCCRQNFLRQNCVIPVFFCR